MGALDSLFLEIVKVSLTAGIIAGIVFLIRLIIGKKLPRRVCYALWGLVLIRLVLPFSLPSPTSVFTPTSYTPQYSVQEDFRTNTAPQVTFPGAEFQPPVEEEPVEFSTPEPSVETVPESSMPEPVKPEIMETPVEKSFWEQSWLSVLTAIWLSGAAVFLLGGIGSYLFLRKRYQTACLLPDQSLFDRCNGKLRHPFRRRVKIYVSADAVSPLVLGIFRPRIILPEGEIPEDQAVCMVMHELIHIRRGDPFVRMLSLLLTGIHWFNPLIWLALRFSSKDMELSCDEAALSRLGENSVKNYATALLELSVRQHRGLSPLLMFGESNLKTRVKNALSYKKPALWVSIAAVVIVAAGGVFLLTDPVREPAVEAGDVFTVDLAGMSLQVTADAETAALLNPENWTEWKEISPMEEYSSIQIAAEEKTFTFSQTDPQVSLQKGEETIGYKVPLGTEETLRAKLLENSVEYAALPPVQQEMLSALVNAETLWGMRDYADYFAVRPEFIAKLSAAILSASGENFQGELPYDEEYQEIYLHLVNPTGTASFVLKKQGGAVFLSMGEQTLKLPVEPFEGLFEEFQATPYQGWSTNMANPEAPGFTKLTDLQGSWSTEKIVGNYLVTWAQDWETNHCLLTVWDLSTGEMVRQEESPVLTVNQIRPLENSQYDLELSGYENNSQKNIAFVWGVSLDPNGPSDYVTNPDVLDLPNISTSADLHLTDAGMETAEFNGYLLGVTDSGGEYWNLAEERDIREVFKEQNRMISDYGGLKNVAFCNNGRTIVADIVTGDYPFANGFVLAAHNGDQWETKVHTGSAYYAQGGLLKSFYKILEDETIACYRLEDAGWTVELIDPDTLETIGTLDFGGYSYEYLSLEGRAPLSISGDSFYSPRVVIRLIDQNTAAVVDRSYKLNGQRLYFLDLEKKQISDPIELNGALSLVSREWLVTREIPMGDEQQYTAMYCRSTEELLDTMTNSELRPLLPKEQEKLVSLDQTLLELFNDPSYVASRTGNYAAYSNQLFTNEFRPTIWTLCEEPPVLPAKPGATANIMAENSAYANANFYDTETAVILELLPWDQQAEPLYYQASKVYPTYAGYLFMSLEDNGEPAYYPDQYTGRDAALQVFQAKNRQDILDCAALLQGNHRLQYQDRNAKVLALEGNTAICLVSQNLTGSYAEIRAASGILSENVRTFEAGGYTFQEPEGSAFLVFTQGDAPSAVSLEEGVAQGLVSEQMLAEAFEMAGEEMPRLYRDETTFRVEQLLNYMNWTGDHSNDPAAMFHNQFYYRFAELFQEYRASDKWEPWKEKLSGFLESHADYANFQEDMELALTVFLPGEVYRAAIQDAWGDAAEPDWERSGNLLTYYPEEDIVATAYGIGFESSSHCYPISMTEQDGRLLVQYATLYWYPGDENPNVERNGETVYLGESWPDEPTLQEIQRRAAELPLQTAEFVQENGRWILTTDF